MKHGTLLLVVMAAALGACARTRPMATPDNRAGGGRMAVASASAMDSRRDIILAVANPLEPPPLHAGSSLLGYAPSRYYGAGQQAASTLAALKKNYRFSEVAGWPIKTLGLYCIVLQPPPGASRDSLLKVLAGDRRVRLAQPLHDYAVYAKGPGGGHRYNDPYVSLQRGFVETDAARAHDFSQGSGVRIAIVDTGVDLVHPDLQGRIHDAHNMVDDDAAAFNRDSHGTEVAGVIAAVGDNHQGIVGMAPKATLSVYKACWYPPAPHAGARCNSFTLAKALAAILDTDARIVNLSLGGPADPLLSLLLVQILEQGRIVVAAIPPEGNVDGFPDATPGVILVRVSGPSTAPPGVLSAPGNDILTTQPGGSYDFTSGPSMAAPHVSGIAALLLSLVPGLETRTVHDLLLRSSKVSGGVLQVNAASAVADLRSMREATR
ncbi:serine protease [Rhodanobacter sp. FW510-R12]|uniref:S8 family serine peptidase n=1 Tax=unclassified Rhodanobacter TaxID=2621553 RepID=UPI0007A9A378|nr:MULTISPECIES: S8 family serine peptidase [unclassified Rhodanobacter]KZC16625.1 serine protease [Rhodanobacter sp. FW104-R8]KZC27514.1 serine protease [Rhodanobacter sp. FW510-T8]KZC31845.1 serine protease [Rhodanobacter sp. FW510-R10]